MLYARHFKFELCGEAMANVVGETYGDPTISVAIEFPARVRWGPEQDRRLEELFEEVRELVQSVRDQK